MRNRCSKNLYGIAKMLSLTFCPCNDPCETKLHITSTDRCQKGLFFGVSHVFIS